MKKQAKQYSAEEKTRIVLEAIKSEMTIAQISSKYGVHSTQISVWKKQGLESLIQGFKIRTKGADSEKSNLIKVLYEQIGQLSLERDCLKKNLSSLDLKARKDMVESELNELSIGKQCQLLGLNRSTYYYKPAGFTDEDLEIMKIIDETYTMHPYYGTRRMAKFLQGAGFTVGRKGVRRYYRIMGIEAIYPKMNLSKRNMAHKVYPYLLRGLKIIRPNQVWSADITYIRLHHGFVYLVAIIDWYSRYILSWQVSITLESEFCVSALEEALSKYGKPEIFNTDQGVQFTSLNFTKVLTDNGGLNPIKGRKPPLQNPARPL